MRTKLSEFGKNDPIDSQARITILVTEYERVFNVEFKMFRKALRVKKANLKTKWAETGSEMLERLLYEVPETLDSLFMVRLSEDDKEYLGSLEGSKWFTNTFAQYRVTEKT